jgi:hypothetical protein
MLGCRTNAREGASFVIPLWMSTGIYRCVRANHKSQQLSHINCQKQIRQGSDTIFLNARLALGLLSTPPTCYSYIDFAYMVTLIFVGSPSFELKVFHNFFGFFF